MNAIHTLGLIGDVHAEDAALALALNTLIDQGVDHIVCTGDIVDGPGDVQRCCDLLRAHDVGCVRGNHDRWLLQNKARHIPEAHRREKLPRQTIDYLSALPSTRRFDTVAGSTLLCHGADTNDLAKVWPGTERAPIETSPDLDALIETGTHRFVLNGHMHFRCVVHFHAMTLINAGTLRRRHRPGFSRIDFAARSIQTWEYDDHDRLIHNSAHDLEPAEDTRMWRNTQEFDGEWEPYTLYSEQPARTG